MDYFNEHWRLAEWLSSSARRDPLIAEDASKRSRLTFLRDHAQVPSVTTVQFPYREILAWSTRVAEFAEACGDTPYALRLTPLTDDPALRERGKSVRELIGWARGLQVPMDTYECVFEQHVDSKRSAIFVCTENGVWGEYHEGSLLALNRGAESDDVIQFSVPWRNATSPLPDLVQRALKYLDIPDKGVKKLLEDEYDSVFRSNHLLGYFEVVQDSSGALWFVDYNRLLIAEPPGSLLDDRSAAGLSLRGRTGARGTGRGVVLHAPGTGVRAIPNGTVLIAPATRPELIGMMASSRAVVTEVGGILSHAAIACRELGIPCVVGVKRAVSLLAEGTEVIVNADAGEINVLQGGAVSR